MYEIFEHTADIGLRVRAHDLNLLFSEAAKGLFSLIVANLDRVQCVTERAYNLPHDDYDLLLFDWLSEMLFTFETDHLLFSEFNVQLTDRGLTATCRGEQLDLERHAADHEVKAITYHGLKVEPVDSGWFAEVIVDI